MPGDLKCKAKGCDHLADSDTETFQGYCEECAHECLGPENNDDDIEPEWE